MWETLHAKLAQVLDSLELSSALAHPGQIAVYFVATAILMGLYWHWCRDRRFKSAFWCVVAFILVTSAFYHGGDTKDHVYRILVLSRQIKEGHLDLLFPNWATGDVYPVFVYYSFLPYILPTALTLAGLSAAVSFKIAMGLQLLVFAAGLQSLLETRPVEGAEQERSEDYLLAILFISATYVYGLWLMRAAFGELWACSLTPWVVRFSLSPRSTRSLIAMLFLQACAHPLVFLQSIIGESVVAIGLSPEAPLAMIRRIIPAAAIAVVLAIPFWLPQLMWLHDIRGDTALPIAFPDTFLSLRQLLDPTALRNVGLWIPCAVVLLIVGSRGRLPWRAWLMLSTFISLAALQTVYARGLTEHIPVLNLSQFVWRLMQSTAFIAFGALLLARRGAGFMQGSLASLTMISVGWMVASQLLQGPKHIAYQSSVTYDSSGLTDASGHFAYAEPANVWGIGLFAPDYSRLRQNCAAVDRAQAKDLSFRELRDGVRAEAPFIFVRNAPIGFVDYLSNGVAVQASACRDGLVLGPLAAGESVRASEKTLDRLLDVRALDLIVGLSAILLPIRLGRRPRLPIHGY